MRRAPRSVRAVALAALTACKGTEPVDKAPAVEPGPEPESSQTTIYLEWTQYTHGRAVVCKFLTMFKFLRIYPNISTTLSASLSDISDNKMERSDNDVDDEVFYPINEIVVTMLTRGF